MVPRPHPAPLVTSGEIRTCREAGESQGGGSGRAGTWVFWFRERPESSSPGAVCGARTNPPLPSPWFGF